MRLLAVAIIVFGGFVWLNRDRQSAHALEDGVRATKRTLLDLTCPPRSQSPFCHIIVSLLYDSGR